MNDLNTLAKTAKSRVLSLMKIGHKVHHMVIFRAFAFAILTIPFTGKALAVPTFPDITGVATLEFLAFETTIGRSWSDISGQFGFGGDFEDYRYASRVETETLLDALWGGTNEFFHASNSAGANRFLSTLGFINGTPGQTQVNALFLFGTNADCSPGDSSVVCLAQVSTVPDGRGYFTDGRGLSEGVDPGNVQDFQSIFTTASNLGSLLVKEATVPEPGTLLLTLCGLAPLLARRQRKTAP